MSPEGKTAFICYSREDSQFVRQLALDLKGAGAQVWMDKLDIRPGQDWAMMVEGALKACARMLVILSPNSVNSPQVRAEFGYALNKKKEVIPVLYRECEIPYLLQPYQFADFTNDYQEGVRTLLDVLEVSALAAAASASAVAPGSVAAGDRVIVPARIEILDLTRRVWPVEEYGFTGVEYFIDVFNASKTDALKGVRVELVRIEPDVVGFSAPLHIKHEDYDTREFSLNPRATRQVDILTGPINHPRSQEAIIIPHTVNNERFPLPRNKYRLTIQASAKNAAAVEAIYDAWVDENGDLQCKRLHLSQPDPSTAMTAKAAAENIWADFQKERLDHQQRAGAEQSRLEEERRLAAEQAAREQQQRERNAAEEARKLKLEEERKAAVEQARLDEGRKLAAEKAQREQEERQRLAAEEKARQAKVEEERKAAEEQARKEKLEEERKAAEERARQQRIEQEATLAQTAATAKPSGGFNPLWIVGGIVVFGVVIWLISALNRNSNDNYALPSASTSQPLTESLSPGLDITMADTYRKAMAGDTTAMVDLGLAYASAKGAPLNYNEAVAWYRKAADAGNPGGMAKLGQMYEYGLGIKRDPEQAMSLYRKAAELGDSFAENQLKRLSQTP